MAYKVIHTKSNGAKYVYSVESYWDKEKKAARNRQVCLGRLNEENGEIIPSQRKARAAKRASAAPEVTARSRVIGPYLILRKIADDTGLTTVLKLCFPVKHAQILSLAFFLVQKGLPLSRCETWSTAHAHPYGEAISSQRVSELLSMISEDERQGFFKNWMDTVCEKDWLCYDLTSVSSYSELNEYVKWGYNRDDENLPQINLGMLFGQQNGLPVYYRRLPGSVGDVAALRKTISSLDFIGQNKLTLVMDKGFYSEQNLDALLGARLGFVLAIPHRTWIDELYDSCREKIFQSFNRRDTSENEVLYALTHLHEWKGRRCYVHIFYNNFAAAMEVDALDLNLTRWRYELVSRTDRKENEKFYKKYFIIRPLRK